MNDVEAPLANIFQESELTKDAAVTVAVAIDRIGIYGHIGIETVQQGTDVAETCDIDREPRTIQSIGGIDKLSFRTADIEVTEELQHSDAAGMFFLHELSKSLVWPLGSMKLVQTEFQWYRTGTC